MREKAILIPQRAVIRTADGKAQVYVVQEGDVAQSRDVELGQSAGNEWVVESGLSSGERVVVDGGQKLQPGAKVAPEEWRDGQLASGDAKKPE